MEKENYEFPKLEILLIQNQDIITTSGDGITDEDGGNPFKK